MHTPEMDDTKDSIDLSPSQWSIDEENSPMLFEPRFLHWQTVRQANRQSQPWHHTARRRRYLVWLRFLLVVLTIPILFLTIYRWVHAWLYPPLGLPISVAWGYFDDPTQRTTSLPSQFPKYNDTFHPDNIGMTDETCSALFPQFGSEVDRSVLYYRNSRKRFVLLTACFSYACSDPDTIFLFFFLPVQHHPVVPQHVCNNTEVQRRAHIRAIVYNGALYIRSYVDPGYTRGPATLAQLHQALQSSPESLPNVELCFGLEDRPARGTFGLARPAHPLRWPNSDRATSLGEVWLAPDYGFLTWPEHVGSYKSLRNQTAEIEATLPWQHKAERLLWRGSMSVGTKDRYALLATTDPYLGSWSDVKALDWSNREGHVAMADHCRWKYSAVPEGVTYTGRLRNLVNCRSVIVMHPPQWVTFWNHKLIPHRGTDQNVVYVPRTPWWRRPLLMFSEHRLRWVRLPSVMKALRSNDEYAQHIAQNSWKLRDRHLSPASVACYWRRALRGYATVQEIEVGLSDTDVPFTQWIRTWPKPTQQVLQDAYYDPAVST